MEPLLITLLGGVVALDGTSVGQFMISRPLVAGTLAGWLLGDPVQGMLVGAVLEVFVLPAFPVGGGRFPEGGPAAVAGAALATQAGGWAGLAFGVLAGLLVADLGGSTIIAQRRLNRRLAPDPEGAGLTVGEVLGGHLTAVALDFVRGSALVFLALLVGGALSRPLVGGWPLGAEDTEGLLVVGVAVSAGALLKGLGAGGKRVVLFLLGVAGGVAAAVVL